MTTQSQTDQTQSKASQAAQDTKQAAQQQAQSAQQAWNEIQENPTPSGIMGAIENLPTSTYVYATFGSIGLSLLLRLFGRREFANFIGLWPPTILALAMVNKRLRPAQSM